MSEPQPIVIVGGGIVGLALGFELGRRGARVLVLERERPGAGATAAAGGMLAPISEAELEEPPLIELGRDSLARYPSFVADVERVSGSPCRFDTAGTLWIALDRDQRAELEHLEETLLAKGLPARRLDAAAVRAEEPHLSSRVLGGLAVSDLQVDPRALALALARAIPRLGGEIAEGWEVGEIVIEDGTVRGVRGRRPGGAPYHLAAEHVVVAAGAWSDGLGLAPGTLGLRPVKGQLVRLRGPRLLRRVVRTPDVYLIPREDGELLVGATMEEMGFDLTPTAGAVLDLLRHGWEAVPALYDLTLAEVSVGLRSATDDHLPLLGPAGPNGLWLAIGHFRNGVLLAPATAAYLAEAIASGETPAALGPFLPARVASRRPSRAVRG